MISSLVAIQSLKVVYPSLIKYCALLSQTSVPCESPDILTKSENVCGWVSTSIWRTNLVPNSGKPYEPTSHSNSSFVTPRASGDVNKDSTFLSFKGIVLGSNPVISCNILSTVGSSCPSISNLSNLPEIEW